MKKLLSLMLAATMLLGCVFALSSCFGAKPELDLEDAAKALEKKDYMVNYADEEDFEDTPYIVESLSAYDEDDNYLYITVFADAKTAKLAYKEQKLERDAKIDEAELEIKAMKLELEAFEHILDTYEKDFEDDEDVEMLEDQIDDLMDEIEEAEEDLKEFKEEYVIGRSGKTVWYGTKDAVEDSKR